MTLYSLRTALDDYRITKFDRDLNVESSYLIGPITPNDHNDVFCECPAGTRSTCRHRQMLGDLLPLLDTEYFWDFERHTCVDANGNPSNLTATEVVERLAELPSGVAILDLSDPANLHTTISDAVGEPNLRTSTPAPWRRI